MICIKLQGGLGNQLFQYATARRLAATRHTDLKLDTSWYKTNSDRSYSLDRLNIIGSLATDQEIHVFRRYQKRPAHGTISDTLSAIGHNIFIADRTKYWSEKSLGYDADIDCVSDNCYLEGYFQSDKYFDSLRPLLVRELSLRDGSAAYVDLERRIHETTNPISVHMRRGDYLQTGRYRFSGTGNEVCSLKYYSDAIELIKQKIGNHVSLFYFSDDPAWVKRLSSKHGGIVVSGSGCKDHEELFLMSACRHNIIANSTFSWWGAWLNDHGDKVVVSPRVWFEHHDVPDIIPHSWIPL